MSTHIKLSTSPIKRPETVNALLINHYKFVFDFNVKGKLIHFLPA